jgi:molybdopterin/thiamine biosynthesis adenylyltransferase
MLDMSRIQKVVDIGLMQTSHVAIIGSASRFAVNMARTGLGKFSLVDFDRVSTSNIPRQEALAKDVGRLKIEATRDALRAVNGDVDVRLHPRDVTTFTPEEVIQHFGDVDLFIFATDRFRAQAFGNTMALRLQKPALYLGLYERGEAGEIVVVHPAYHLSCYRCLMAKRYRAHEEAQGSDRILDPASDGTMIADLDILDGVAAKVALSLLHAETDAPIGNLFHSLGHRQLLQFKLSPEYTFAGRDILGQRLGIAPDAPHYAGWGILTATADPSSYLPCPDCQQFRDERPLEPLFDSGAARRPPRPFRALSEEKATQ